MDHPDRHRSSGRRPAERVAQTRPDAAEQDSAEWDDTVDVICVGSGTVGLAAAMVVDALELSSELVIPPLNNSANLATRLGVRDPETIAYLESVTDDIPAPAAGLGTGALPIRLVEGPVQAEDVRGTVLPTFNGAALQIWAAKCLAAPGGILSTKVADPNLTVTYQDAGCSVETLLVGSVDFDSHTAVSFEDWMADSAADHGVAADSANELQRLVFDNGAVVGAVLGTPSGARIVRARYAVVLVVAAHDQRCTWPTEGLDEVRTAQVAFVTRAASRYGRLELLVATAPE